MDENDSKILSRDSIINKAKEKWDNKKASDRLRSGSKYRHIFVKYNLPSNDWSVDFNKLNQHQKSVLLKGELIRQYDSLSNLDKTKIKRKFGLLHFSSKWFKLLPQDKKTLLNSILYNE